MKTYKIRVKFWVMRVDSYSPYPYPIRIKNQVIRFDPNLNIPNPYPKSGSGSGVGCWVMFAGSTPCRKGLWISNYLIGSGMWQSRKVILELLWASLLDKIFHLVQTVFNYIYLQRTWPYLTWFTHMLVLILYIHLHPTIFWACAAGTKVQAQLSLHYANLVALMLESMMWALLGYLRL